MEAEIIPTRGQPRKTQNGKYHNPLPADLEPMRKKYEVRTRETNLIALKSRTIASIDDSDMLALLERYATDETVDVRNLSECFGISVTTLFHILRSDKWKEAYYAAKKARASMLMRMSLESACTPYELLMNGDDIHPQLVKAAALRANHCFTMAQTVDPELNLRATGPTIQAAGQINIQVNSGIPIKDF